MRSHLAAVATALTVSSLAFTSGCELLDELSQRTGVVDVFTTSHGTPDEDGNPPDRNGEQLVFLNDMGWQVFVDEAFVTTEGVTLRRCDGPSFDVEFYWGALAEDIAANPDFDVTGLGGVRVDSGSYCTLEVEYGPSAAGMDNPDAVGSTVFLAGSATKGDLHVEFAWRTDIALDVDVDISGIEAGSPFHIGDNENFSKKLTVDKSYTHFFRGIDFELELSQADIDALLTDTLATETRAFSGTDAPTG